MEIRNDEKVIFSSDIAGRITELEEELELLKEVNHNGALYEISGNWGHSSVMIHEDHLKEHAKNIAEESGVIRNTEDWPADCIDWDEAVRLLKTEYFTINFDGETYWVHS